MATVAGGEMGTLEKIGTPVGGLQKVRVGVREFQWLGRALRTVDFFDNLTTSELDKILPSISLYVYPADRAVVKEGAKDEGLFVLYIGRVVVSRKRRWRLFSTPVKSLLPGDFFGEIALLERRPRTATVSTTEASAIFCLQPDDFRFVLEKNKDLANRIRQVAAERQRELHQWEKS